MTTAKDCHALTSYYEKKFKERYNTSAVVNRNDARWKFDSILKSLSVKEVMALMDFWFETDSVQRHPIVWFFYNYDKLITVRAEQQEDSELRSKLRKESEERARKWRERRANRGE
jgi:hypothetical protein